MPNPGVKIPDGGGGLSAAGLALAALLLAFQTIPQASAQQPSGVRGIPTTSVAACDNLAAHPDDDGRPAGVAGVADEAIVAARAISVCELAVEASPETTRFHFQLARAYWAAKRFDEAIDSLLTAEDKGYAPAYFYLAEAYDYGLIPGEKADPAVATALYALAAEGGFPPAIAMLGYNSGSARTRDFDAASFARPGLMKALHEGNLGVLKNGDRLEVLTYLQGLHDLFSVTPNEYDASCPTRSNSRIEAALDLQRGQMAVAYAMTGSGMRPLAELEAKRKALDAIRQEGVDDSYLLITELGGCTGPAFERIYATIRGMVQ